jgi:hypothetical protein
MYICRSAQRYKTNPKTQIEEIQAHKANLATNVSIQVRTTRDTNLVLLVPLIPDTATTLSNGHHLSRNTVRKQRIAALIRRIEDPLNRSTAALAQSQRVGDLHGSTTTGDTLLLTNPEERRHGVDDESEVEDRVEGELGCWGSPKETAARVNLRRRGSAEVIQNERHVLIFS